MKNIHNIAIIFLTIIAINCFDIKPLYAGTIVLEDDILRKNTCIGKKIDLPKTISSEYYNANKDISMVAYISSLSMDQYFNFNFHYEILCPSDYCYIDFNLIRFTENVNQNFTYQLRIDYLIAHGLKMLSVNMTYYKQIINLNNLISQRRQNQLQKTSEGINEWQLILIPNGFNNMTKTGFVQLYKVANTDLVLIEFQDYLSSDSRTNSMGWALNHNYILYKAFLMPTKYKTKARCNKLQTIDACSQIKDFTLFISTKQKQVQSSKLINSCKYFTLQTENNSEFIDLRHPQQTILIQNLKYNQNNSRTDTNLIFIILVFLIVQVIYIMYRNSLKKKEGQKDDKLTLAMSAPDLIIAFQMQQDSASSENTFSGINRNNKCATQQIITQE